MANGMYKCPSCGANISETVDICPECGKNPFDYVFDIVYSNYTPEDLRGKCVIRDPKEEKYYRWPKNTYCIKYTLERIGAKEGTLKDSAYVLWEGPGIDARNQFCKDLIVAARKKTSENDPPLFIHYKELLDFANKTRKADMKKSYANATPKAAKAMKIFDKLALKIDKKMRDKNYNSPIVVAPFIKANRITSELLDIEGVNQFFDYAATHFEKYSCIDYRDPKEFRDNLNSFFQGPWDFDGLVGLRLPLAAAIAISVFVDENCTIILNFAKDRWEYSGYYRSRKQVGLQLDPENREGIVF